VTSVPDITRLLARIAERQDGHGKPAGRAEAAHRLEEANKLLDEVSNMLGDVRRTMLTGARPGECWCPMTHRCPAASR
jgi:hypothetical protein